MLDDKEGASVEELDDHILLLEAARHRLDVEWTESLGVFEERRGHDLFGHPSVIAYLRDRARIAGGRANRYVSMARAARRFAATFASWRHRHLTTDQAELLFRVSRRLPDAYPAAEEVLVEIAGDSAEATEKALAYWTRRVDERGAVAAEAQLQRRRLDYSRRPNGMIEGDFALTESAGEAFIAALDAAMPPISDDDDRSPTQRRHDALVDLAHGFLGGGGSAVAGGERPHVTVHVDLAALEGNAGGLHESETGRVLDVETIRLLSCDSSVSRIVWSGRSEVLDVGRKTRVVPAAMRRAVIARDRHCVWRGCTRQPRWCDVHHLVAWADGGDTVLDNLCLLCRYHHTLVHSHEGERGAILDLRRLEPVGARPP